VHLCSLKLPVNGAVDEVDAEGEQGDKDDVDGGPVVSEQGDLELGENYDGGKLVEGEAPVVDGVSVCGDYEVLIEHEQVDSEDD